MQRIDLAASPNPQPQAGPLPAPAPSPASHGGGTSVALKGDRVDAPRAAPTPDPNGTCPVPNLEGDRQQLVQGLTIGGAVAGAIVAPEVIAATGLDELAGTGAAAVVRGASSLAQSADKIGSFAGKQFAEEATETAEHFKDAEAFGKLLGHQAHSTLSTLGQSLVQGAIGAGIGALLFSKLRPQTTDVPPQPVAGATPPAH